MTADEQGTRCTGTRKGAKPFRNLDFAACQSLSKSRSSAPAIQSLKPIPEVIMNARQRDRAKRAAKHREKLAAESRLEQRIESIMTGCSGRVSKALYGTLTLRDRSSESGSQCLQDVGLFFAGHRKSNQVTAR